MTDYEGDRALAKKLLAEGDAEKIALALRKAWHEGLAAGKRHRRDLPPRYTTHCTT